MFAVGGQDRERNPHAVRKPWLTATCDSAQTGLVQADMVATYAPRPLPLSTAPRACSSVLPLSVPAPASRLPWPQVLGREATADSVRLDDMDGRCCLRRTYRASSAACALLAMRPSRTPPRPCDTMKTELILIANASEARLLSRDATTATLKTLDSVHRLADSAALGEPRSVQVNAGVPLDPRHRRMRDFAVIVARRIETELAGGRFTALALFAACPFLGELMRQFDRPTKLTMRTVVDADISDL